MEEVFLQLRGEVARLQELCSEQARLLQRLKARKGPVLAPEKEDAPRDVVLPGEALVEIRGPVKTCWTPGWALEEETPGTGPTCGAAPACDLCREIFPSDAAGHAEYLNRVLARLE
ncbi:hypothetical protein DUI87_29479 [Hirundo rustica rustica]|uniref:Uncharacterized protein n=1 Tax=Hirundo rustica rustica TaxID=333673 RepID=A0A3M0IZZ6_HIRRU|nr:hypothetical protein DUI87_29479 [Hirundo rustica rustica]